MKIGIYAGTFDPIHSGHLGFAQAALAEAGLDKIFFLVEPTPRRKQGVRAFEHRVEMTKLATRDQEKLGNIILEQPQFTVQDTLPILQARFHGSELYMLLGEDVLAHLISWPQVSHLLSSVGFVIGVREGHKDAVSQTIKTIEETKGIKLKSQIVTGDFPKISSSTIRLSLRRGDQSSEVPESVLNYIRANNLYRDLRDYTSA